MNRFTKWLPALTIMVVIFLLSSLQRSAFDALGLDKESYHVDGHFIMYVLLGAGYFHATKSVKMSVLLAFFYGVLDEIHQLFVPTRAFEYFDILVDTIGGFTGSYLICRLPHLLQKKPKN